MIIVDEILDQMDATKSGVVAGSVTQTIQSGVETVPTSIIQQKVGGSAGNTYTTLPLYPIVSNCCMDKSFIHMVFNIRFDVTAKVSAALADSHLATVYLPMWFGPNDTSALPNQVQVLLEGSTIYNTNYQREESVLSNNSLPEILLRGSDRYSTIDKLKQGVRAQPMQRLLIPIDFAANGTTATAHVDVKFDLEIDMNTLNPLLSNMHFTTKHFGKLQLKLFFAEIEKALCFCPDYNFSMLNSATTTSAITLNTSLLKGQIRDSFYSFYPFAEYVTTGAIDKTKIPFYGLRYDKTGSAWVDSVLLSEVTFSNSTAATNNEFFKVDKVDMCQTNFDIRYEEYQRLESHFTSMGSIIIPTQTWRTTPFQSSPSSSEWSGNYVGIGSGNNIDFVGVWCHSLKSPCCFYTLPLTGVQFQINGQNINPIPYPYIDRRAVTDFTQAIIDTDHEEISKDYTDCLNFLNIENSEDYVNHDALAVPDYYNRNGVLVSPGLSNANKFAMYFSTNLPDSFHTGKCVLEDTVNTPNVRLIGSYSSSFRGINTNAKRALYPIWYDNFNGADGSLLGFSLFCDYCIVLKYDASRGVCFDGVLSPAAPYL